MGTCKLEEKKIKLMRTENNKNIFVGIYIADMNYEHMIELFEIRKSFSIGAKIALRLNVINN